jgi:membrane associated rhomboid family serine protease
VSDQTGQPGPPAAPPDDSGPATCYRHPAREAHVRCTRCNRRICPDCMIDASVGFQCPECVREGNKGVRDARTSLGGRLTDDSGRVTKVLIAINLLVFLAQQASASFENHFVLIGSELDLSGQLVGGVADGQYYRLLTAAFMHYSIWHIAFNMYALYLFGPPLEATLGRVRFTSLYLLSALGGSAASYAFIPPNGESLGASGAVFGLFGAFFVVNRKFGRDNSGLFVLLAINLAIAFIPNTNIDWHAHVGGLLTGSLVASALVYAPRDRRTVVQAAGVVVVLLIIVALVVWRTTQLT